MEHREAVSPTDQMLSPFDLTSAQSSYSFDIDEFLDGTQFCNDALGHIEAYTDAHGLTQACTHAHACNPSGPDTSHTHTCIHVHTQIMPSHIEEPQAPIDEMAESVEKKSRKTTIASGNREAVRKYREKKKARAASLEDEVVKLRAMNQELMKRLQNQALLEAEVARLKCLLEDIRGRIDGDIGSFPYQKPLKGTNAYQSIAAAPNNSGTYMINLCNMQNFDPLYCLVHGSENAIIGQALSDCDFDNLQCVGGQSSIPDELQECTNANVHFASNTEASGSCKRTRRGSCGLNC